MFRVINNPKRIYAFLLALAIIVSMLIAAPVSASAKSSKKKEAKITNTAGEWQKDNGVWCFVKPDGTRALGEWVAYDGAWYYIKPNGRMAEHEWVQLANAKYFIKSDATMAENQWLSYGGAWYWFKSGGAMAAGEWLQKESIWYWLKLDGKMAANEKLHIDGKNHNFDGSGQWLGADLTKEQLYAAEVLRLTNIEREKYDLPALSQGSTLLTAAASVRAQETITYFSHARPDGRLCFTAYTELGGKYKSLGENIAMGYRTPSEVIQGWMNSPGHRSAILSPKYSSLGVGVAIDRNGKIYWAQMFHH